MKKFLFYFLTLLAVVACSDEERDSGVPQSEGKSAALNTSADFIRLSDDSTNVAGVLRITAQSPSIELKWNVPAGCNIDTTLTQLKLSKGVAELPIKWTEMLPDSLYGPSNMAFKGGVLITAGDYSKYVNLVWADEVDSTQIANHPVVLTRSADMPLAEPDALILTPNLVELDPYYDGVDSVSVIFGKGLLTLTKDRNTWREDCIETNVEANTSVNPYVFAIGWKKGVAPSDESFTTYLTVKANDMTKYLHIVYLEKTPTIPLECVGNNLPTGNIPATATVYTFEFEGGYTGQFRVRSVDATTGTVLFNGPIGTTHSPKVTVPANTSTDTRNIKFQYRLIDIVGSLWEDLPANTNRIQDAQTSSGTVIPGTLTPDRALWEYGEDCSCEFTGDFNGDIIMHAMVGTVELARATGKINERISVSIPQLFGLNRIIKFEYSIDKEKTWTNLGNRTQINEYVSFVDLQPYGKSMPANGQTYTWGVGGTYSKKITFQVSVDSTDEGNQIYEESAVPSHTFSYTVPKNPKKQTRLVIFRFKLEDDVKWTIIDTKYQDASK